ncbi:MAG: class I SAM-dependent methyltransferase [Candidatus Thermoplasmatota archaeon]|nr:class I SAM-dependent methyltransferase [Candidatus Thermoplasmatota archaeon]
MDDMFGNPLPDEFRERLLKLSEAAEADGEPLRWFEELYSSANRNSQQIPWARMEPHPKMVEWIAGQPDVQGKALVIGCGLGDDAEWLSAVGFEVTAFDISGSSIEWCKERFPSTDVDYVVADLLNPPEAWLGAFDLVVEIHILQAIPEEIRDLAAKQIPVLLNGGGFLLCIGRLSGFQTPIESPPPWPLSRTWLESRFAILNPTGFNHFVYDESPSVDRYLASWMRGL